MLWKQYGEIGIKWYANTLPFERKVQQGSGALVPLLVVGLIVLLELASSRAYKAQMLELWAAIIALIGSVFLGLSIYVPSSLGHTLPIALFSFAACGALAFGGLVVRLRDSQPILSGPFPYIFPTGLLVTTLIGSPFFMGKERGLDLARELSTSSPTVALSGESVATWTLVDANGDTALLSRVPVDAPAREFRLAKLDATTRVFATSERKGSDASSNAASASPATGALGAAKASSPATAPSAVQAASATK